MNSGIAFIFKTEIDCIFDILRQTDLSVVEFFAGIQQPSFIHEIDIGIAIENWVSQNIAQNQENKKRNKK